jgi:hypothetical protein
VRPILLRSAGVVGLTAAILGVISSGALFAGPDSRPAAQVSGVKEADAQTPGARVQPPAPTAMGGAVNFTPAAGVFTRDTSDQAPSVTVASIAPAPQARSATPASPPPAANNPAGQVAAIPASPPAVAASEPATSPEAPAPSAGGANLDLATAPASESEREADAESESLWSDDAVECPRDWVAESGNAAGSDCRDPGAEPTTLAAVESDQSALDEAAVERASEEAGLQFAARLPMARPDYKPPAPPRRKNVTKAGASRPAGPPPKCGSKKRAKWRFVNKTPTWYCK